MTNRVYDPKFILEAGEEYSADFEYPKNEDARIALFNWIESFTTGPYIAFTKTIIFTSKEDRNFFILGYDEDKFR